jgi:hypothetical protein
MAEKAWGTALEVTTAIAVGIPTALPAAAIAAASGVVSSMREGKTFDDGYMPVNQAWGKGTEAVVEKAGEFGDRHADKLTAATIQLGAAVVKGIVRAAAKK